MSGPLKQLTVVEFAALGPAPLAGQLLADLGADVIVIDRHSGEVDSTDVNRRGKLSIALNLKSAAGLDVAKTVLTKADVLIEGFRPGVMEKLGLGPSDLSEQLIYARMTGWGQDGPLSQTAGHDLNYLGLTGALAMMGDPSAPPVPPLNLVADFGGGTMFLLLGILSALYERQNSGKGQVVDAAMVDGVPAMMGLIHTMAAKGLWVEDRGQNMLDGGAPYYRCYETKDGKYMSVGPIEPKFFAEFLHLAQLPKSDLKNQNNPRHWPDMHKRYAALFKTKTRKQWSAVFEGSDACVAPVLSLSETSDHPHNAEREIFIKNNGVLQASPAPRFSRSLVGAPSAPKAAGADTHSVLQDVGFSAQQIEAMRLSGDLT